MYFLSRFIQHLLQGNKRTLSGFIMAGHTLNNINRYADDIVLVADSERKRQCLLDNETNHQM